MTAASAWFPPGVTIGRLLRDRASLDGNVVFCRSDDRDITYAELEAQVRQLAGHLVAQGLGESDRVAVMLPHHPDHILVLLALTQIGAVAVPLNPQQQGAGLEYILEQSEPAMLIGDQAYADRLVPALARVCIARTLWRGEISAGLGHPTGRLPNPASISGYQPPGFEAAPETPVAICYTSGTTGAPKGVLITDKMYRCAATSSLILSGIEAGDVPLFWEPMYHLFGIEVVVLALMKPVTLAMVDRFSASTFWVSAARNRATHIHYVGGVLQLLLRQPPAAHDRTHCVRVAWGGGCPPQIWHEVEQRFGLNMRDSFGMTETSALNIVNLEGIPGALGRPLPYFEARVVDDGGQPVATDEVGQLLIRGNEPGLVTSGYFRNPQATTETIRDGWLHTGDLVRVDAHGVFHFFSRRKDCVRRRGENVSPWEVERVLNEHPDVEECSLVGVRNEFGDEDLKIFIKPTQGRHVDPSALHAWCLTKMARYQVPRFIEFTDEFPRTATQRIRKHELSRSTLDCWDAQAHSGPASATR
jgi:crotonobetaine/carnitine-CoA ligase